MADEGYLPEVGLNAFINYAINKECEANHIPIHVVFRKKWGRGIPDGIVIKGQIPTALIEYKSTSTCKTDIIARAICQMLCYTYDKYGDSIVPIRRFLAITDKEVVGINFDKFDILYENFKGIRTVYNEISPSSLYDGCSAVRYLLSDIDKMLDFKIPLKELDLTSLISYLNAA